MDINKTPQTPSGLRGNKSEGGGSGIKNISVTINGGINPAITLHTTNISDSASKIKRIVSEALLGAVNDANLATG